MLFVKQTKICAKIQTVLSALGESQMNARCLCCLTLEI